MRDGGFGEVMGARAAVGQSRALGGSETTQRCLGLSEGVSAVVVVVHVTILAWAEGTMGASLGLGRSSPARPQAGARALKRNLFSFKEPPCEHTTTSTPQLYDYYYYYYYY